jgi:hypothetical protein
MQPQHTENEPSSTSFAGLLSALTAAKASPSNSFTDGLENDVATLTYERALQNHARYRSGSGSHPAAQAVKASLEKAGASQPGSKLDRKRKTASVTLRMSPEEFVHLQQRAVEANLSVSAYLRSCTFEAEALRSQVKQALTELRNPPQAAPQAKPAASKWLRLIRR